MSTVFSNILLAFDGSDGSYEALKRAKSIAKQNDAHLNVVYVQDKNLIAHEVPVPPNDSIPHTNTMYVTQTQVGAIPNPNDVNGFQKEISNNQETDKILSDAKVRLSNVLKKVDYEILAGKPAHEICEYAEKNEVDLIVIGNRGLSGIKKLVMGSVSAQVTNQSHCPVLVCK